MPDKKIPASQRIRVEGKVVFVADLGITLRAIQEAAINAYHGGSRYFEIRTFDGRSHIGRMAVQSYRLQKEKDVSSTPASEATIAGVDVPTGQ